MDLNIIKLLVIEDDQGDSFLLNEMLSDIRNNDFSIKSANDLQSAMALQDKNQFDIILTDLGLPDSQGMSTLKTILDLVDSAPVIVLTGLNDYDTGNESVKLGAQDYLVKGEFDTAQLERAIRYAISRNKIEEDLRASETRMRALFENGPDAYFITDLKGNIIDGNHEAEKLNGFRINELVGQNIIDSGIIPKDQHPKLKKALAHLNLGMAVGPEEIVIKNKNGREIFVESKFFPVEVNGEAVVFANVRDITDIKLAAARKKQYNESMQLLAKASIEMIQFYSGDQVLDYISDSLLKLMNKNSFVAITDISENAEQFTIRSFKSKSGIASFIEKLLKKEILNLKGKIIPEVRDQIGGTRLLPIEVDLKKLSGGILNKTTASLIEKFINLKEIYVMSMMRGGKIYAHLGIFTESRLDSATRQLIEAFINQASIVMERITYQEALHESEERYKVLFDSSPQGIAVIGPGDRIINWNKPLMDMLGISEDDTQSIHIPDFYKDINDRERLYQILKDEGVVQNFEAELLRMNGQSFISNISLKPISYEGVSSRMVVMSDITDNKRSEEERKKLYKAIEQSPSMIMITDAKGIIEYVNPSFCSTTGFSQEDALGNQPSILKSGLTPNQLYTEMWQKVQSGENWQGVLQNRTKEGSLFWANLQVFPIKDEKDKLTHFVGIIVDFTEMKKAEEELVKAKVKAEESDQLKTAFLTNMSHEIRTPMNAILGFSELLSSPDHDEEKKLEFVEIIQSRSKDLMGIINNLVDVSKIESGQIHASISTVSIHSIVSDVFEKYKGTEGDGVLFNIAIPKGMGDLQLKTDPIHLKRILSNLVENAIKYTDHGKIVIGVDANDSECIFSIHDTGIGIHPDKATIIFNRFMQAEVVDTEARGGNGLGLTISKNLTEILEGKIWFDSEKGKGSSFYVSLPFLLEDDQDKETESGYTMNESINWSNRTVLVAEDDISNFMVLKHYLDSSRIKLKHVNNGMMAVEAFKNNGRFDMILMDMKMPLMNGFEASRVIRNLNSEVPIIALTASIDKLSLNQCLESGCNEYLSKPMKHIELINTIHKYFNA